MGDGPWSCSPSLPLGLRAQTAEDRRKVKAHMQSKGTTAALPPTEEPPHSDRWGGPRCPRTVAELDRPQPHNTEPNTPDMVDPMLRVPLT